MHDHLVRVAVGDGVTTLTLDSPHNRNALSAQLVGELRAGLDAAAEDGDTRIVVIDADGPAFCAGADLSEMTSGDDASRAEGTRRMLDLLRAIAAHPCPVVVKVHAAARAGGIGVIAACDVAVASTSATFSLTEVRLGLAPAVISTVVQPRMHPRSASLTWLTGETFGGDAAAEHGLVTTSCAPEQLDEVVDGIVTELLKSPGQGLAETKALLNRDLLAHLDEEADRVAALSARLFSSEVAQGLMARFLDR